MHEVTFSLNDADYKALEEMAKTYQKSKSEIVLEALYEKAASEKYETPAVLKGR